MSTHDWMPNYAELIDRNNLKVVHISNQGIVLRDERYETLFTVVWNPIDEHFELVAVPAWPEEEVAELVEILKTVYDERGVDIWLTAALAKGWKIETALQRAAQLRDGAFS